MPLGLSHRTLTSSNSCYSIIAQVLPLKHRAAIGKKLDSRSSYRQSDRGQEIVRLAEVITNEEGNAGVSSVGTNDRRLDLAQGVDI
jgi:hypothetical protein